MIPALWCSDLIVYTTILFIQSINASTILHYYYFRLFWLRRWGSRSRSVQVHHIRRLLFSTDRLKLLWCPVDRGSVPYFSRNCATQLTLRTTRTWTKSVYNASHHISSSAITRVLRKYVDWITYKVRLVMCKVFNWQSIAATSSCCSLSLLFWSVVGWSRETDPTFTCDAFRISCCCAL